MISGIHGYWRGLANGSRSSTLDRLLLALLTPISLAYALIQRLRAIFYRTGVLKSRRLPIPVISIGNLTVGGTGKTPVTAHIARFLLSQGYRVAALSRGYGGSLEGHTVVVSDGTTIMLQPGQCGDEPFLLASTIPGLMVVIGSDRYAAGLLAMELLAPDVFLLDDGFQHMRLQRDLDILLLDHSRPFGNGWTLPAGLLREPASAISRGGLIIRTRCSGDIRPLPSLIRKPVCYARHELTDALPLAGGTPLSFAVLQDKDVLAFAGIAEPHLFFEDLRRMGLNLVETIVFSDHTEYSEQQLSAIMSAMHTSGAQFCITTEKDGVKLMAAPPDLAKRTLLARLALVLDNPETLKKSLLNLLLK
jgi:tetraacyldisaccharide 4'-kinase